MKVEENRDNEIVKAGNENEREVYLSRHTVKVAFEGRDSNLSLCIEKLRLVFKQLQLVEDRKVFIMP